MSNDIIIRLEKKADYRAVENLTRDSFWNVYRPGCLEHYVLHCFRDNVDFIPELDFVMEKDGKLIGHVMYAKAKLLADDGRVIPLMTFGPISIAPEFKRQGYGTKLLSFSMEKAKALGCGGLLTEGNIGFYGTLGFKVASTIGINYYVERRDAVVPYFIYKELKEGFFNGVTGVYTDPDGYNVDLKKAEVFDSLFPYKEKLKLPGQLE
ncbi:MAG: N-acetyltransferase [Spirochaetales bacterium]|nr:N-acetyltransferase [Spirochaetales bacterium]